MKSSGSGTLAAGGAPPAVVADWTVLVYMAGDNDLDSYAGADLREMKEVGSNQRVHIVVQCDRAIAGAHRYYLRHGTTLREDELAALGTINTGDPRVLEAFLVWGLAAYPAKRTMVILWNHGNGWDDTDPYATADERGVKSGGSRPSGLRRAGTEASGFAVWRSSTHARRGSPLFSPALVTQSECGQRRAIAFDDGAQDFLDSVEIKSVFTAVLREAGKFNVIGMDACLMSMVENGLQVQAAGEVFCGSQEVEPGAGWPYHRILRNLVTNPAQDGRSLAAIIVDEFAAAYASNQVVTQSAVDLAALSDVRVAVDALGELLAQALAPGDDLNLAGAIVRARRTTQRFQHPDYVDLWDFAAKIAVLWPAAAPVAEKVQNAVAACVIANTACHPEVAQAHGLSIYLPMGRTNALYSRLELGRGGWFKFISGLAQ